MLDDGNFPLTYLRHQSGPGAEGFRLLLTFDDDEIRYDRARTLATYGSLKNDYRRSPKNDSQTLASTWIS
jgi:hypothetical protein